MSNDLSNLDKFILRVQKLRDSKVKEATFDVAFLGKVIDEISVPKKKDSNQIAFTGGTFKENNR